MALRILAFQHPGTNSREIFADIIDGYREAGHEVLVVELAPLLARSHGSGDDESKSSMVTIVAETVLGIARANNVDLAVTLWGNAAVALGVWEGVSLFEHFHLPVIMHWLDAPQWAHEGKVPTELRPVLDGPHTIHAINNPGTAIEVKGVLGFNNVLTVGHASNPKRFRPHPDQAREFDIVFGAGAGHSPPTELMLAELAKDEPDVRAIREDVAATLRPELCAVAGEVDAPAGDVEAFVDLMIQARLECRDEPVLGQIQRITHRAAQVGPVAVGVVQHAERYIRFSMMLRRIESWERAFTFAYLSRYFRCAQFGSGEEFESWPGDWERLGWLPYDDQAKAYSRGWFGLNVMRWQDDIGVNLKPFEITLSGACLLQSYRAGIDSLFDSSQIVVFRTPQECRQRVTALLEDRPRMEQMAASARARSLAQHGWKHRAEALTRTLTRRPDGTAASGLATSSGRDDEAGSWLVFVLGMWRSGTTLLRKVLDSHTQVYAPAETWFLLPLLDLWEGHEPGAAPNPSQAAVAMRGHVDHARFLDCCRAFAARFYRSTMPAAASYFVDKTPRYLRLAEVLPDLFPAAKFIVLTRDPRGTVWSQHTWKHIDSVSPEAHFAGAAEDNRTLDRFLRAHPERSLHVRYERLCDAPAAEARAMCAFLNLPFEPGMIAYGHQPHHEGYGDEKTREHDQPHTQALARWSGADGLTVEQQAQLATECGPDVLTRLGYPDLAALANPEPALATC
ncbi:MAG: glycosyltransferase [bacterium]|nr:glycosyltransferase [bacterium]